jgi:hypothetical protein
MKKFLEKVVWMIQDGRSQIFIFSSQLERQTMRGVGVVPVSLSVIIESKPGACTIKLFTVVIYGFSW